MYFKLYNLKYKNTFLIWNTFSEYTVCNLEM